MPVAPGSDPVFVAGLALAALLIGACRQPPAREVELHRLEEAIVAPCCWRETLATHDSGPARELRDKVRASLERGDRPEAILAQLEVTYGPRIRAAPHRWSRSAFGAWLLAAPVVGGLVLLVRVARRARPEDEATRHEVHSKVDLPPADPDGEHALVDRLDDELDALD